MLWENGAMVIFFQAHILNYIGSEGAPNLIPSQYLIPIPNIGQKCQVCQIKFKGQISQI